MNWILNIWLGVFICECYFSGFIIVLMWFMVGKLLKVWNFGGGDFVDFFRLNICGVVFLVVML